METVLLNNKVYDTLSTMIKKDHMNTKLKVLAEKTQLSLGFVSDIKSGRRLTTNKYTIGFFATYFNFSSKVLSDICKLESLHIKKNAITEEIKKMEGKKD